MAQDAPWRRRARPVADAPLQELLTHGDELARGWALALLESAPLDALPGALGADFPGVAPRLCVAALRALQGDSGLAALAPGGEAHGLAASAGAICGATGPVAAAAAVDRLGEVLWSALRVALAGADPELPALVAQRLAGVGAVIREAAMTGAMAAAGPPRAAEAAAPAPDTLGAAGRTGPPAPAAPRVVASGSGVRTPLWMAALVDEVEAARLDGRAFSLLLVELEDAERLILAAAPGRVDAALGEFLSAIRRVTRESELLVREGEARVWVISRGSARAAAHSLGARIAEAVGDTPSLSGAPLVASVGVAVLGEDGHDAAALAEAAEEARFAASARGIEVSRRVPTHER